MAAIRFLITLSLCFICTSNEAQTRFLYNNKYSIELPDKLELQESELNTIRRQTVQGNKIQVNVSTSSGHITFQQKGLNADTRDAYNKYCRVIIEYFKEDMNNPVYGRGDKIVIDRDILNLVHKTARDNCNASGTPLIKVISVQSLTINGFPVIYYSYKRKGWEGKQPPVIVNVFWIFNRYESVALTFSYREAEREMWKDIHNYIIKAFYFTRKY